jgi:peroxiredoxin
MTASALIESGTVVTAAIAILGLLPLAGCKRAGNASSQGVAAPPAVSVTPAHREVPFEPTPSPRLGTLPDGIGIAVGATASDFKATDIDGRSVQLSQLRQRGPLLLAFYRGGWCPYCSFEIHGLTKAYPEFQRRGVTPVAISVDRPEESNKTKAAYVIPFPVLSDSDLAAHRAFRVVHEATPAEAERLRQLGIDLARASGRVHHSFAVPAFFLVDRSGVVRWAHADEDYKVRPSTEQLLRAIDQAALPTK